MRAMLVAMCGVLAAFGLQVGTAAPAAAIPGLENVVVASAVDSNVFKSVTATCPVGKRIIGGGARLTLTTGEVSITRMAPNGTTAFDAWAYEDRDGFAGVWGLVVTAICATTPAGYEIQVANSPSASPATAAVTVSCSAGRQLLGSGGSVFPGRGVAVLTAIVPGPLPVATTVTVTGAETQGGFVGQWNVQAWAICAAPAPGLQVVVTTSAVDSLPSKTQVTPCPAGRFVHGVGFHIGGAGVGEVFLDMAFPNPSLPVGSTVPVVAAEDQDGVAGVWGVRSYAICAT